MIFSLRQNWEFIILGKNESKGVLQGFWKRNNDGISLMEVFPIFGRIFSSGFIEGIRYFSFTVIL